MHYHLVAIDNQLPGMHGYLLTASQADFQRALSIYAAV